MKPTQTKLAAVEAENLLGDFHPLVDQIGSAEGLNSAGAVNSSFHLGDVKNFTQLKTFLENYRKQLLAPIELPLICQAYQHASRGEFCELISLDQEISRDARLDFFASASKRVGQIQLKRLQPLRDQRGLQKYLRSVDAGESHGWHTLVYGITLASFSFPLRQGLLNYAQQTLEGFIRSSGGAKRFSQTEVDNLLAEMIAPVPHTIDVILPKPFPTLASLATQRTR